MSQQPITIHDGPNDTTVRIGVDGAGKVNVDHDGSDVQDAAKAVTSAMFRGRETDRVTLLPPDPDRDALRVFDGAWPNLRQLLALRVDDGRLAAEYEPCDLSEAAKQFVDAVMHQWIAEMDENRRFTADTLAVILRDAAKMPGAQTGETISVEHAANVLATILWGCR